MNVVKINNCNHKIFPDDLVSGSVKSQEELDAAFLKHSELSHTYVQTALYWEDCRNWYEKHWLKVCKYLDDDFVDRFKMESEHTARAWEFHIAAVFTERGLQLEKKTQKNGPDFCIKLSDGKNLWVEAIACDLGIGDPVEPFPDGGNIEDIHRSRALRITSAIKTKLDKFKNYLENSNIFEVNKDDCLLIAVNGSAIQNYGDASMLFRRAVFGQGLDVYIRIDEKKELQGPFYKPISTIKRKGSVKDPISANFMEMSELSKISAVLYCGYPASHSWDNGYEVGDDFLFAYHVNPDNPIPDGFFKFGRGIRKDIKRSVITEITQK